MTRDDCNQMIQDAYRLIAILPRESVCAAETWAITYDLSEVAGSPQEHIAVFAQTLSAHRLRAAHKLFPAVTRAAIEHGRAVDDAVPGFLRVCQMGRVTLDDLARVREALNP